MANRKLGPHWSADNTATFKAAGWPRDGRNVERLKEWKAQLSTYHSGELPDIVASALSEFGGMKVQSDGPGIECARSGFEIDPLLAIGEEERFAAFSQGIGSQLFPLGEALDGNAFLGMDAMGRVYLVGDQVSRLGSDIYAGLEALLLGLEPQRISVE